MATPSSGSRLLEEGGSGGPGPTQAAAPVGNGNN